MEDSDGKEIDSDGEQRWGGADRLAARSPQDSEVEDLKVRI
ncbi:hypothetical protein [Aquimonas voraii]|nr:hypothetical protein [Aquimonas voraii]